MVGYYVATNILYKKIGYHSIKHALSDKNRKQSTKFSIAEFVSNIYENKCSNYFCI